MVAYSQEDFLQNTYIYLAKNVQDITLEDMNILKAVVAYHNSLYYQKANPIISDYDYDQLYVLLKQVEQKYSNSENNSLTQKVGNSLVGNAKVYNHFAPMLSLENSYNENDMMDFHQRMIDFLGTSDISYNVEPKIDGAGVSLYYKNDILQRALTRGDGLKGEDITAHIKTIPTLPIQVEFSKYGFEEIEIRGEIVLHKKDFELFNEQILSKGGIPLANPRNAVAGTLRLKNIDEVRHRRLSLFLYHVSYYKSSSNQQIVSQYDSVKLLTQLGIPTMMNEDLVKRLTTMKEVITYCNDIEQKRDSLPYEIDGMVIKLDNTLAQNSIGSTAHHPRWAMALKFKPRSVISTLKDVEFQVGRTGMITPVAKINPVALGGVTIKSISLFNEDNILQKDIRIGDEIVVERAGDVIPYIARSLPNNREGSEEKIIFPSTCPSCGEKLIKMETDDVAWRCVNYHCPAQSIQRIIHFASKDAMDIQGLGSQLVKKFCEKGILKELSDIYSLPWEQLKTWEGLGEKSIEKLKNAVENSKKQSIHRLIFALGIRFVGEGTAKTLARHINHILDLQKMSQEDLQNLEDIGEKVSLSIIEYFKDKQNILLLNTLEKKGLNFKQSSINTPNNVSDIFLGKKFLFTGTLSNMSRNEAETFVEKYGGKILSSVSSQLNYLVVGESPGSKLQKAKKIDTIQILTENEFLEMLSINGNN